MKTTTDYNQQAIDFLEATQTTFKAEFKAYDYHFTGDKEKRDIYTITLERKGRKFTFDFGQSIMHSGKYMIKAWKREIKFASMPKHVMDGIPDGYRLNEVIKNPDFETPTAYSVLACLTKYDPGNFDDFCSEFGYEWSNNKEYREVEKTYLAVVNEYHNVERQWFEEELELLREIQ